MPAFQSHLEMDHFSKPSTENGFLADHVRLLQASLQRWTGRTLVDPKLISTDQARALFHAPFAVVSHNTATDPVFNYANRTALQFWDMNWEEFTQLLSRHSAEPVAQAERTRLLEQVTAQGYIDDYSSVRISRNGQRFRIEQAVVWNLVDEADRYRGQAACFSRWEWL